MDKVTYQKITELEAEKDALIKETADKGNDKFEVIGWGIYKRKLEELQTRLDALYRQADWD